MPKATVKVIAKASTATIISFEIENEEYQTSNIPKVLCPAIQE